MLIEDFVNSLVTPIKALETSNNNFENLLEEAYSQNKNIKDIFEILIAYIYTNQILIKDILNKNNKIRFFINENYGFILENEFSEKISFKEI